MDDDIQLPPLPPRPPVVDGDAAMINYGRACYKAGLVIGERRAKRDAERYRWLKINMRRIDFAGLCVSDRAQLNARIDDAMSNDRRSTGRRVN